MRLVNKMIVLWTFLIVVAAGLAIFIIHSSSYFDLGAFQFLEDKEEQISELQHNKQIQVLYIGDSTCERTFEPSESDAYLCFAGRSPIEIMPLAYKLLQKIKIKKIVVSFSRYRLVDKDMGYYKLDLDYFRKLYELSFPRSRYLFFVKKSLSKMIDSSLAAQFTFRSRNRKNVFQDPGGIFLKSHPSFPCFKSGYSYKKDASFDHFKDFVDVSCLRKYTIEKEQEAPSLNFKVLSDFIQQALQKKIQVSIVIPPISSWMKVDQYVLDQSIKLGKRLESRLYSLPLKPQVYRFDSWDQSFMGDLTHVNVEGMKLLKKEVSLP